MKPPVRFGSVRFRVQPVPVPPVPVPIPVLPVPVLPVPVKKNKHKMLIFDYKSSPNDAQRVNTRQQAANLQFAPREEPHGREHVRNMQQLQHAHASLPPAWAPG